MLKKVDILKCQNFYCTFISFYSIYTNKKFKNRLWKVTAQMRYNTLFLEAIIRFNCIDLCYLAPIAMLFALGSVQRWAKSGVRVGLEFKSIF